MAIQSNFPNLRPSLLLDFANTKQLDSRITYTRASTASFYNGVTTAKAEENFLTYSQEFDNAAWAKTAATVTANTTTAPDGTTTADSLVETAANNFHITSRGSGAITSSGLTTFSCFAKANTRTFIVLQINEGANRFATLFNLSTGAVVTTNTTGSPTSTSNSITSVGSGWYRCIVTCNVTSTCDPIVALSDSATPTWSASVPVYTGDGTSGLYIWGAQLEQRSAVTAYTATTTQAITNYIPALQSAASGVARFDNNPTTGESLGLLIEESRTNLITYSSDFTTTWVLVNSCTITANTIVAPDGTLTGDKLVRDSAANGYRVQEATSVTSGTAYTFTCYAKASQLSWIAIGSQSSFPTNTYAFFNLSSGVLGTIGSGLTSASITSVGNGWYRCSITATANATGAGSFQIWLATSDNNFSLSSGNTFDGVFLWGAQFEAGSFATSYIPTVASQVTRAADAASMTGTNFSTWFNAGQGSIYTDSLPIYATGSSRVLAFSDGTSSNRILLIASNGNHLYVDSKGVNVADLDGGSYSSTTTNRQGSAFAVNDFAVTINSGTMATDTSGAVPSGMNRLYIGADSDGTSSLLNGTIKKLAYYPLRLTNAQLQALTS